MGLIHYPKYFCAKYPNQAFQGALPKKLFFLFPISSKSQRKTYIEIVWNLIKSNIEAFLANPERNWKGMEVFLSNCIQNQQLGQESEIKLITSTVYFLMCF